MPPNVAFVADGTLFLLSPGRSPAPVVSPFANEVRGRAQEIHRKHAWKTEGRGAMFMSRGLLWGPPGRDPKQLRIRVVDVARNVAEGDLLYALDVEGRSAVCRFSTRDGVERRLLHGSERQLGDLAVAPRGAEIACSVAHADGSASLAVMSAEATDLIEVTEGEVRDTAPSWAPGPGRRLVYASAGVGRDAQGRFSGLGPSAIQLIDLERGTVEELASDSSHDLLRPQLAEDGSLYYLSRPHARAERPSAWRLALDLVLLPVRLLYAVFQYLSFFSARYTGRPLTTAGGPERTGADARRMQQWSNLIEAEEAVGQGEPQSSIPSSWQLVHRLPDGSCRVLAESVLAYDLAADGHVVYTTGSAIHLVRSDGSRQRLTTQSGVTAVAFAG